MRIRQIIAAAAVAISAPAFSQALPLLGTYVSADGNFKFTVDRANAVNGQIRGAYATSNTPVGAEKETGAIGNYAWVKDEEGHSGQAPFEIKFGGHWRPDSWSFVIRDQWNGAYLADNTILAQGSRTYVAGDGSVQVTSLGTQVFMLH